MPIATTGIIVDDSMYLTVNATQFTHLTSWTMTLDQETIDVTSWDSNKWKDFKPGDKSWSMSAEAHFAMDAAEGGVDAIGDLITGSTVTVLLTTGETGDITYTGSALYTSTPITASKGSAMGVSINLQGTGALTPGTVGA